MKRGVQSLGRNAGGLRSSGGREAAPWRRHSTVECSARLLWHGVLHLVSAPRHVVEHCIAAAAPCCWMPRRCRCRARPRPVSRRSHARTQQTASPRLLFPSPFFSSYFAARVPSRGVAQWLQGKPPGESRALRVRPARRPRLPPSLIAVTQPHSARAPTAPFTAPTFLVPCPLLSPPFAAVNVDAGTLGAWYYKAIRGAETGTKDFVAATQQDEKFTVAQFDVSMRVWC